MVYLYCMYLIQNKTTSKPVDSLPNSGIGGGVGGGGGDGGDGEIENDDMFSGDGEEVDLLQGEREEEEELRYGSTAISSPQPHHEDTSTNQEVTHVPVYNTILACISCYCPSSECKEGYWHTRSIESTSERYRIVSIMTTLSGSSSYIPSLYAPDRVSSSTPLLCSFPRWSPTHSSTGYPTTQQTIVRPPFLCCYVHISKLYDYSTC